MSITEIRKNNLRRLVGGNLERGESAEFARQHNLNADQVRHILTGHRNMGEKLARKLEETLNLPTGTLDREKPSEVIHLNEDEQDLLIAFKQLSSDDQVLVKRLINSLNS